MVRVSNAVRIEFLAFAQACDNSWSCLRVTTPERSSSVELSVTATQDNRLSTRAFSSKVVFCSSDTACLYTVLNFREPATTVPGGVGQKSHNTLVGTRTDLGR